MLYTNPRGSTEIGEKHLWDTWGGWAAATTRTSWPEWTTSWDDFPVDPKRLGVTGYSYGGFLTNWVITQTQRFQAAIVGAASPTG